MNFKNATVGLVNCYDGANHLVYENGKTSVLSFNSQLFNRDILDNSSSTSSSNIFTWQQEMAKKNWSNLERLVKHHYEKK